MLCPLWRMIHLACIQSRVSASGCLGALVAVLLLICPVGAHADTYNVTFINVTFTATCIGGGTCTEVINGSALYDPVTDTGSNSTIQMTGTLNVSFDVYGVPPQCTASGCVSGNGPTGSRVLYDPNALPGFNPIEFAPAVPAFSTPTPVDVPTPQPLLGGPNGSLLFVPGMCGGDQPACNTTGAFPGNGAIDYQLTSGTYTAVDITAPEPGSLILFGTGAGMLGLLSRRRHTAAGAGN